MTRVQSDGISPIDRSPRRPAPRMVSASVAVLGWVLALSTGAEAGLVFDNFDGPTLVQRLAGLGTQIEVANTITVNDIAIRTSSTSDVLYKFAIFDATTSQTSPTLVYASGPKAFSGDANNSTFSYKMSDDFSFTLLAGRVYYIGAVTSTTALFSQDQTGETQNGISSSAQETQFTNYPSPTTNGTRTQAEAQIQLYSSAAVPEPASMAMLGLGMAMMGGITVLRRRTA